MDCGTICPICFSEYTTAGSHRVMSLKCGHLFGSQCIEKWISRKRTVNCPTCATKCTKRQLRAIYASKIIAVDTENEQMLIEKYLKEKQEKNEYIEMNNYLRNQIEHLKLELMQAGQKEREKSSFRMHKVQKAIVDVRFDIHASVIEYDDVNCFILVTCRRGKTVGVQKFRCNDFSIAEFISFGEDVMPIRDIVMSPFGDGLGLVPVGNTVILVNMYDNSTTAKYAISNPISSVCFDNIDRNMIYCGDDRGLLYCINIAFPEKPLKVSKIADASIHSLYKNGLTIFASTVHRTYKIIFSGSCIVHPLEIESYYICTNMSVYNGNFLFTFRDSNFGVKHFIHGIKEAYFRAGVKQIKRHRDRIHENYIYVVDDERRSIRILSLQTLVVIYSYTFKEEVMDFAVKELFLFVLTRNSIHVFCNV